MAKKILIVEDEKSISKALELKLSGAGYEVSVAYDGQEALNILPSGNFDLVLLDLVMPNIDGFKVLAEMHEKNINSKVIVTTNLSQEEDKARVQQYGVSDYLVKSDTPLAKIMEKIQTVLGA